MSSSALVSLIVC